MHNYETWIIFFILLLSLGTPQHYNFIVTQLLQLQGTVSCIAKEMPRATTITLFIQKSLHASGPSQIRSHVRDAGKCGRCHNNVVATLSKHFKIGQHACDPFPVDVSP